MSDDDAFESMTNEKDTSSIAFFGPVTLLSTKEE